MITSRETFSVFLKQGAVKVELRIDADQLARMFAVRVLENKSGRASALKGAVSAKLIARAP